MRHDAPGYSLHHRSGSELTAVSAHASAGCGRLWSGWWVTTVARRWSSLTRRTGTGQWGFADGGRQRHEDKRGAGAVQLHKLLVAWPICITTHNAPRCRAKNLVMQNGQGTQTGRAVEVLQNAIPNARCAVRPPGPNATFGHAITCLPRCALGGLPGWLDEPLSMHLTRYPLFGCRVLYSSATGASEPLNMVGEPAPPAGGYIWARGAPSWHPAACACSKCVLLVPMTSQWRKHISMLALRPPSLLCAAHLVTGVPGALHPARLRQHQGPGGPAQG